MRKNAWKILFCCCFLILLLLLYFQDSFDEDYRNIEVAEPIAIDDSSQNIKVTEPIVNDNGSEKENISNYTASKLEVYFFNVGQADSVLIKLDDKIMLVDTGNAGDAALDTKIKDKINLTHELKRLGVDRIDILVATHAHEDHMGSMYKIIKMFEVSNLYANAILPVEKQTTYYKRFVKALEESTTHLISPTTLSVEEIQQKIEAYNSQVNSQMEKGILQEDEVEFLEYHAEDYIRVMDTIPFGNATVTLLAPNQAEYADLNDSSLVFMVEFEDVKLLLTGDAGKNSEEEILEVAKQMNFDLDCDILKVGHHGSRTANTEEFISAVSPEYAIIMVEEGNSYGLPDEDVIERLVAHNAIVYQTSDVGDIKLIIDDGQYTFDLSYAYEVKEEK